jgi:predicted ribosome quality control (RQC) complex YloA/Tae2 family protein
VTGSRGRPRAAGPDEPARPFRRYLIEGKWEVWVGRSSAENDELTHRAAHNRDIWLHAQGVAGSHVVLRTQGHPERVPHTVLAKAAALAALHSKARHAQLVPVVHTEKRYVRKPRKSPPGTAVCLRDRSLFARPGVMPGVEPI